MDYYKGTIPILEDRSSMRDHLFPKNVGFGMVPRDYNAFPEEMFAQPDEMELVPESEDDARYDYQEETKSSLEYLYLGEDGNTPAFVNLDQNGQGFCWAYSVGQANMIQRLRMGLPLVRLSPHAVACKIKNFRDEGGWCGLSAKFAKDTGYPSEQFWPQQSMAKKNDNAETWANAALHKIVDDWVDLRKQVYDQNLTMRQLTTCGFNNNPGAVDFNWWGHSVCFLRRVRIAKGDWGTLILNSWKNWGRFGLAVLRGSQGRPDGAIAIRSVGISTI